MIRGPATRYVATAPVDLRASFDALAGRVRGTLHADPGADAVYIFHNKRRTLVKLLWRDATGWYVLAKRLDAGTDRSPRAIPPGATHVTVAARALAVLLEGLDPALLRAARRAGAADAGVEFARKK